MEQTIHKTNDGLLEPMGTLQREVQLLYGNELRRIGLNRATQYTKQEIMARKALDNLQGFRDR